MFRITVIAALFAVTIVNAQRNCPNGKCNVAAPLASQTQGTQAVIINTDPTWIHPTTGDVYDRRADGIYTKRGPLPTGVIPPALRPEAERGPVKPPASKSSGVPFTPSIGQFEGVGAQIEGPQPEGTSPDGLPTGVDWGKIRKDKDTYSVNGKEVPRKKVEELIEGNGVKDESNKKRIVVVGGTAENRTQALDIIGKPDWAVVTAYPADHWYVKQSGFIATGAPNVYVQSADGKVEHRQDNLVGLKEVMAAYDPSKDPDKRKGSMDTTTLIVWGLIAFAGYKLLTK